MADKLEHHMAAPRLLIIDTDPGVDDAMAILLAAVSPEVRLLGLTTVYGNVPTQLATQNALRLVEMAGLKDCVVAQGAARSLRAGLDMERIADFVHGPDGFGGIGLPPPKGAAADTSAAEFIVHTVRAHPGKVTILALAPLTNIAQALMLDPDLSSKWEQLVILGGAFFVNGNVNPAAEANIFGDPEAADLVLGQGGANNIRILGLDVTMQCKMTGAELEAFRGKGKYGTFIHDISKFYLDFHKKYHGVDAIYLHDPTAMAAVLRPELFSWQAGAVRVATEGVTQGHTIMDATRGTWHGHNAWQERPPVQVALGVEAAEIVSLVRERLGGAA